MRKGTCADNYAIRWSIPSIFVERTYENKPDEERNNDVEKFLFN